jgi:hypothetical protein
MKQSDIWCIVAIVTLATILLAPALRPGYTLLPLGLESGIAPWHKQVTQQAKNLLLSDPFYTFYPRRHFFTASVRQGIYPLWNPCIFGGHPVMGDTAAQTFYPPNLAAAIIFSAARALPILAWFHLVLTGLSMFAFLRLLCLRSGPALFGAVAWMLNGNMVVWLENPHRLSTLAWLPAIVLFYELALQRRRIWPSVLAGFFYGFSILGGHTQFALGNGIVLAVYALLRGFMLSGEGEILTWRPLTTVVVIGLLGVGLGAVQLLPTFQLSRLSHRAVMDVEAFLRTKWPFQHLIGLWIPDFYGNPVRASYWGLRNYAEVTVYYGALTLLFSLTAIVWSRRAMGKFFAALQMFALLIVIGTPLTKLIAWLPGVRYFRLSSLIAYLPFLGSAAAAFALESAMDLDHLGRTFWGTLLATLIILVGATALIMLEKRSEVIIRWAEIYPQLLRAGLILLGGLGSLLLVNWRPKLPIAFLVLILAIDLLQWGMPFNPVNSLDILYPENEVTNLLREDSSLYRVLPLQTDRVIFGPNVLSVLGFQEIGGYSSLMSERYRQLVKAIDSDVAIWWMRPNRNILVNSNFDPLFSLLNVKYILSTHPLDKSLGAIEVAQPGCAKPGLPLTAGARITHTFQAHHPGLNRVDVGFVRMSDAPVDSVRFLLWKDCENGKLIADITTDEDQLPENGEHTFFFAPVADSMGRTFVWAVEVPEADEEASVAVCQAEGEAPGQPAFTAYSTQLQLMDVRQGVWIYENPNVLPRAYVVHRTQVMPDQAMLEALTDPDVKRNLWTTVLLEEPLPDLANAPSHSTSKTRITQYKPHKVELEVDISAPGLLVLSDAHYPGWRVAVDGERAQLLRVNYALRGVYVPTGTHQVTFRFVPTIFYVGLALTGISLAGGLGVIWWDYRRCTGTR